MVENYAIGGGIAAIYYLEPYQTEDIDVFIPVSAVQFGKAGLISLEPVYGYLKKLGYFPFERRSHNRRLASPIHSDSPTNG